MSKALSLVLGFSILLGTLTMAIGGFTDAQAQAGGSSAQEIIPVSMTYTYSYQNTGCAPNYPCETTTISTSFSGSANITPVEGGYEGTGSGSYEDNHDRVVSPYPGCPNDSSHMRTSGEADMVVHYQFSIDNDVTGGPDTTMNVTGTDTPMYNSSWGVVEVLVEDYDLHMDQTSTVCGQTQSNSHDNGSVGFGCHFYSLDFTAGGSWTQTIEATDGSTATCVLNIGGSDDSLKIFGIATGTFGGVGQKGLASSKVVIAEMQGDDLMKPLSVSKPDFFSETLTSDDAVAQYEFRFENNGTAKLPRILVVSLLWYVGSPEYAVTNGVEVGGSFVPVYQALCVDDEDWSDCEKWERSSSGGYEAKVDFDYGNEDKIAKTMGIMEMEQWEGGNSTAQVMKDSAFIYYNSYLGVKYFDTLGLGALDPVMIKAHHKMPDCPGAYFGSNAKLNGPLPEFGDLGTFLDRVVAKGSGIYFCDPDSVIEDPDTPVNREWHELGHYLMFQLYPNPYVYPAGAVHSGYLNAGTNDSVIEGFASFVAMLIYEHHGEPKPYMYPVGGTKYNLEQDYKVWGDWIEEEFAVAGILWDLHDAGRERSMPFASSGGSIILRPSTVMNNTDDTHSLDGKTIISKIGQEEPKTLEKLLTVFGGGNLNAQAPNQDAIKIGLNHGAFADISTRNYVHDSWNSEPVGQTGNAPDRILRYAPVPEVPGSNLLSDRDVTFNVTIRHLELFADYDYSYTMNVKAGEPTFFSIPPKYYPSIVTVTPVSADNKELPGAIVINSTDYWNYISSNPPADNVFRSVVVGGESTGSTNGAEFIENVRNLLERVSEEYKAGNATGAEELATIAYVENFMHIEEELVNRNATALAEETKEMLRVELVELMRDMASSEAVDAKIAEINTNLDEAIVIVPEFPPAAVFVLASAIGAFIILTRVRSSAHY